MINIDSKLVKVKCLMATLYNLTNELADGDNTEVIAYLQVELKNTKANNTTKTIIRRLIKEARHKST